MTKTASSKVYDYIFTRCFTTPFFVFKYLYLFRVLEIIILSVYRQNQSFYYNLKLSFIIPYII